MGLVLTDSTTRRADCSTCAAGWDRHTRRVSQAFSGRRWGRRRLVSRAWALLLVRYFARMLASLADYCGYCTISHFRRISLALVVFREVIMLVFVVLDLGCWGVKIRLQIAIEARVLSLSNKIIKKLFETQKKIEKVPHLKISTFDFDMPHMTHRRDFLKFKYVHCSQPHFDCFSSFSIAINFLFYRATIRSYLFFFLFKLYLVYLIYFQVDLMSIF